MLQEMHKQFTQKSYITGYELIGLMGLPGLLSIVVIYITI